MVRGFGESRILQSGDIQPVTNTALSSALDAQVVECIRSVVGPGSAPLHAPRFGGNEWTYLKECLDSTFVSSVGKFVDRFEAELADYCGAARAVAVVNGTAALQIALMPVSYTHLRAHETGRNLV